MKSGWGDVDCLLIYIICDGEEALGSYWGLETCAIESIE